MKRMKSNVSVLIKENIKTSEKPLYKLKIEEWGDNIKKEIDKEENKFKNSDKNKR